MERENEIDRKRTRVKGKQRVGERRRKKGRKKFRERKTGIEERKRNVEQGGGKQIE
jgi:hypothetical protein